MCPGRDERPDLNIKVTLNVASEVSSNFSLSYTVNGPKNIRRVLVLLDKQQVGTFEYAQGNTKSITDTKQVIITGT